MKLPFVQVFGQKELVRRIAEGEEVGSHLISIGNPHHWWQPPAPDERVPAEFRRTFTKILRLEFHDVPGLEHLFQGQVQRIPERRDAVAVRAFFERTKNEATGYTVHCWAGVSRSPAVALGLLYLIHGSEEVAARKLMEVRHEASPHAGLVQHFDTVLGSLLGSANDVIRRERLLAIKREIHASLARQGLEMPEDLEELGELDELE